MVDGARKKRNEDLLAHPANRDAIEKQYAITMNGIRKMATDQYIFEYESEKQERLWASGKDLPQSEMDAMVQQQIAIMERIKKEQDQSISPASESTLHNAQSSSSTVPQGESSFNGPGTCLSSVCSLII